ncbi:MAG: hypothetical protein A2638_05680 [Nitrospirae bacterium RIFCSPHIGHO2_01_FULL_66_17]|nr:MAG: hypothetical protein A2638_05680 [Nitrospirae bacterium RIFCSPHIGHO2_01_FULL_66_17]
MIRAARPSERGIALVLALLMSLMIMALAASVLYVVAQSTRLSGATKRFATAAEAADGAVQAAKDAINQINWGQSATTTAFGSDGCLTAEIITGTGVPCSKTLTLPTATIGAFAATVTVERLYASDIPGGRLEFARAAGGAPTKAIFYRITTIVTGPDNASAENAILYRFTA